MKTYELINSYGGIAAGTKIYGPALLLGSALPGYFTKENLPADGQYGINGFFQSAVEGDNTIFKNVTIPETKNPA